MATDETGGWEVVETPPSYEVVHPRWFGVTPRGAIAGIAAVAFGAAIVALLTGSIGVGVLLLIAALLLAALYVEQARRTRATSFDRIAAAAADNTKALAGFTGASVRVWTRAGREVAKLRLEARMHARERSEVQYALGAACFAGDEAQVANLREQMRICTDAIEACTQRAQEVVERARERTAGERLAVQQTEIKHVGQR